MPNSPVFIELMLRTLYERISENAKPFFWKEFEWIFFWCFNVYSWWFVNCYDLNKAPKSQNISKLIKKQEVFTNHKWRTLSKIIISWTRRTHNISKNQIYILTRAKLLITFAIRYPVLKLSSWDNNSL